MTVGTLYAQLERVYPRSLSLAWDRDGLMVSSDPERQVRRVLAALDVTPRVAERAVAEGFDLVISHHPLLFHPLGALTTSEPTARTALKLYTAGVSVVCFHTRADAAEGGVSDRLAASLGLAEVETVGEERLLRLGTLPAPCTGETLAAEVRRRLRAPAVTLAAAGRPILRVAVSGGEGKDLIDAAAAAGADAYVSGRFGYHAMQDAAAAGLTLIEAGHYCTEVGILAGFAQAIGVITDAEVICDEEPPIRVL